VGVLQAHRQSGIGLRLFADLQHAHKVRVLQARSKL
jgi:hypothetical protein